MAQVPDRVLSWLWSVLQPYTFPRLAYNDIIAALTQFPTLKPKTAVYTYENGQTVLLLCLFGTLAVDFRDSEFRYPVTIWVPHGYGEKGVAVISYVQPQSGTNDSDPTMAIRPGQHVAMDGRIYHPYLRDWGTYEHSNIVNFIQIVRGVFAREPPLVARDRNIQSTQPSINQTIPARPPKVKPGQEPRVELPAGPSSPVPPPLPSKPGQSDPGQTNRMISANRQQDGPPLPPLPTEFQPRQQGQGGINSPPNASYGIANPVARAGPSFQAYAPPLPSAPTPHRVSGVNRENSPVSPISPSRQAESAASRRQPPPSYYGGSIPSSKTYHAQGPTASQQPQRGYQAPPNVSWSMQGGQPQQFVNSHPQAIPPQHTNSAAFQPQPGAKAKTPALDLLTDPFEISMAPMAAPGPAPPIPPNPEKEHLLQMLSETFVSQAAVKFQQAQTAMGTLAAQRQALMEAQSRLQSEIQQVQSLDAALTTNENILHQSIRDCQTVIEGSRKMAEPNIDEVLVAPTVAAQQLWNLCAEEVAIKEAMYCLQRAIGAGRISSSEFVRLTRSLARECFLKMALARKVATGLGLDVHGHARGGY